MNCVRRVCDITQRVPEAPAGPVGPAGPAGPAGPEGSGTHTIRVSASDLQDGIPAHLHMDPDDSSAPRRAETWFLVRVGHVPGSLLTSLSELSHLVLPSSL